MTWSATFVTKGKLVANKPMLGLRMRITKFYVCIQMFYLFRKVMLGKDFSLISVDTVFSLILIEKLLLFQIPPNFNLIPVKY